VDGPLRHGGYAEVGNKADAAQRFPTKPQGVYGFQVLEGRQLGGGVAVAQHGQVILLRSTIRAAHNIA